jgi:hypothetical protein
MKSGAIYYENVGLKNLLIGVDNVTIYFKDIIRIKLSIDKLKCCKINFNLNEIYLRFTYLISDKTEWYIKNTDRLYVFQCSQDNKR